MRHCQRFRVRGASVLVIVILFAVIVGLLAMAMMDRTINSSTRAVWCFDHLKLRLIAESATEELFVSLSRAARDPGSPVFRQLRTLIPDAGGPALPAVIPGLKLEQLDGEIPEFEKDLGATLGLTREVTVQEVEQVSDDALECQGIVRISVAATARRRLFSRTERVTVDRSFRISRATIHHPLQLDALIVKKLPQSQNGQAGGSGSTGPAHSYFKEHIHGSRTMQKITGGDAGEGLDPSPEGWIQEVADAIGFSYPRIARERAQFLTKDPRELRGFIYDLFKSGRPATGLFFLDGKETLLLDFPDFKGRAVIVAAGPVVVGNIHVSDPRRDSITIASGKKIRVLGTEVEANLVSFGGDEKGVDFVKNAHVTGSVISQLIPKDKNLSQEDFNQSKISGVAGADYEGNMEARPPVGQVDQSELEQYCAAFSPDPVRMEHGTE